MWAQLLLGGVVAYFAWSAVSLHRNIAEARAMGVPIIWIPVDQNNILWVMVQPQVWALLDGFSIPWSGLPSCIRYARRGWYFYDRSGTHARLGPVFAVVSPGSVLFHFSDPKAIHEIFSRRKEFVQPVKEYSEHRPRRALPPLAATSKPRRLQLPGSTMYMGPVSPPPIRIPGHVTVRSSSLPLTKIS